MKLHARVRSATEGGFGVPVRAEIVEQPDGVFLFRYTAEEKFAGDTWHETIDAAKEQARFELEILTDDWSPGRDG